MKLLRQIDPGMKLCAAFALVMCLSTWITVALLGELGSTTAAAAPAALPPALPPALRPALASGLRPALPVAPRPDTYTAATGKKLSPGTITVAKESTNRLHRAQATASGKLPVRDLAAARSWAILCLTANFALAAILVLWLRAELLRPVRQAAATARRVASGDLRKAGPASHVTAEAAPGGAHAALLASMEDMNDRLAGAIARMRHGTLDLSRNAGQVAGGTRQLAARANQHASALDDTACALEQLRVSVAQQQAATAAADGAVMAAGTAATSAANAVDGIAATLRALTASAQRTTHQVAVINDIAFETNVLALNAAVQAASSGDAGVGMLAAEVRLLAQRAASAARELTLAIDDSARQANKGMTLAEQARLAMAAVTGSVERTSALVAGMQGAGPAAEASVIQLSRALASLDQSGREQLAAASETAQAAAHLRDQAGSLSRLVDNFLLGPEHVQPLPRIQLVASNPGKLSSPARAMRSCAGVVPVRQDGVGSQRGGAGH